MHVPDRNSTLDRLDVLVGRWTMNAAAPDGAWSGEAQVSFEWLEGRTFLIQRWTVDAPVAPDGIAIIGAGDEPEAFRQYYFDQRGVHRIYEMTLSDGEWRLWREATDPFPQRFSARASDDGNAFTGRWERADEQRTWQTDFEVSYRRAT